MHSIIEQHFRSSYRSWVKRVYSRIKSEPDAEDVVMEAYARVLKYQHTFREGDKFDHWFSRIVGNAVKDWKREQHNQYGHAEIFNEEEYLIPDPAGKRDLLTTIQEEIEKIDKADQREILHLSFILGLKQREIIQITNNTSGSINMLIHKFKYKLREKYME